MIEDQTGKALHQKKFAGEKLTQQELEKLQLWYEQQDHMEVAILKVAKLGDTNDQLRAQISEVLTQLANLTQHIQEISRENDKIRQENARLFQLLLKKSQAA